MSKRKTSQKHDDKNPVTLSDHHAAWLPQQLHYLLSAIRNGTFVINSRINGSQVQEIYRDLGYLESELDSVFRTVGIQKLSGSPHISRIVPTADDELDELLDALLTA